MHDLDIPTYAPPAGTAYARQVRRVLWLTLVLNLAVSAIKAVVGFSTGSLAVLADAMHSLTDGANNVLGLVVSHWSSSPPDREHPYGHQKFEALGALGIAALLGIACFEVVQAAAGRLLAGTATSVTMGPPEIALLVLVLAVNVFVALYERRRGRRLNSPLLLADAEHTLGDIWITLGVVAGAVGLWLTGWQWLDVALAVPVAAAVLWSGWNVLRGNLPWLVDASAIAPEAIELLARGVPGVLDCHDVTSRGLIGRQVFVEMHLVTSATDVAASHRMTEEIERRLTERFGPVHATIHVEPPERAHHD
ncbi:MAG TPA: cation diffusion facilitator family transporter [Verrucomicrobiae bacterium]|nr:cation diffusion facilitator family transporter [Verrucomicrobiae bacterium]